MINEELDMPYTEDGSSTLNNEGDSYGTEVEYDEDEDFVRYRKEQIYQELEKNKNKTKIGCTLG